MATSLTSALASFCVLAVLATLARHRAIRTFAARAARSLRARRSKSLFAHRRPLSGLGRAFVAHTRLPTSSAVDYGPGEEDDGLILVGESADEEQGDTYDDLPPSPSHNWRPDDDEGPPVFRLAGSADSHAPDHAPQSPRSPSLTGRAGEWPSSHALSSGRQHRAAAGSPSWD